MTGLVSVIIAAYNSSQRLVCAVESIRHQTVTDLEIVVIGDAATDDSADRLRDFDDERIRWENLAENWGEQSVPSNRGIQMARGDHVLFLNQDDIYLPDHVERSLALVTAEALDVAWSPYLVLAPGARPGRPSPTQPNAIAGVTPHHPEFDPRTFVPASCTAWRREALEALGGWRTAAQVTVSPSQDLLWRAWRAGMRMGGAPTPTVLVLWSGDRRNSYTAAYTAADNEAWLAAVLERSGAIEREIAACAVAAAAGSARPPTLRRAARAGVTNAVTRVSDRLGIHPDTVAVWRRYRRSGGFINAVRAENDLGIRDFRAQQDDGKAEP